MTTESAKERFDKVTTMINFQHASNISKVFDTTHILNDRQVLRVSREAEAAGRDAHAVLHNMVTSLSLACSVLCAFSAVAVISRNARVMVQAAAYQATVATALALCGVLVYDSSALLAAGGQQSP